MTTPEKGSQDELHRQLTMGECIAITRYARTLGDSSDSRVYLDEVLRTIDEYEVCTTCGWSRSTHEGLKGPVHNVGMCAHWTRDNCA